ncbi:MAG: hypothetical protein AB7P07_05325 [Hyphomonadaceae bacterium]
MSRRRVLWLVLLAGIFAIVIGVGVAAQGSLAFARVATTYAAKQTCSCLHVSGRALDSCISDFPADAAQSLTVSAEGDDVRASALFGAISASARYEEGFGCAIITD